MSDTTNTKTLFTQQAKQYAASRPTYPNNLYDFIQTLVPEHDHVIDGATGSGQAARQLVEYFKQVTAFDVSAEQIAHATPHPQITYHHASAEAIPAADQSADIVTVATGAHWFDLPKFYDEVRRVAKPHAAVCLWSYGGSSFEDPKINDFSKHLASEVIGEYWSRANLDYVASGYKTLPFPFEQLTTPEFAVEQQVTMQHYLGYLRSWSATQRFVDARGYDPIETLTPQLERIWGDPQTTKRWHMPIFMKAGYVHQ